MRNSYKFADVEVEEIYEYLSQIGATLRAYIRNDDFDLEYINELAARLVERFDYLSFYEAHYLIFMYFWRSEEDASSIEKG
jgi:hypothetical protein